MKLARVLRFATGILCLAILTLAACGQPSRSNAAPSGLPRTGAASVKIPEGDRFLPYVTRVAAGTDITFRNDDADAHTVTSVPGDPSAFNLRIEPGATVTLRLRTAGAYRYYCSIHATYDPTTDQVAGKADADHPNEPMAGVLVVG
jgi:plastocyanin